MLAARTLDQKFKSPKSGDSFVDDKIGSFCVIKVSSHIGIK